MTTNNEQQRLVSDLEMQQHLEWLVGIRLDTIKIWTRLPSDRTDWELETMLQELSSAAHQLRQLRNESDLPF